MLIFAANKVIFGGAAGWLMHHKTREVGKIIRIQKLKGDIK